MVPRSGDLTRTTILESASELLELGGLEAVTLREVGTKSGVSRTAAYRHFKDKAELLDALAEKTLNELADSMEFEVQRKRTAKLRAACIAYVDFALQHPRHYQLIFGDKPLPEPSGNVAAAADRGMKVLAELTGDAINNSKHQADNRREVATVIWVLLHGLAQLQISGHLREPRTANGSTDMKRLIDLALNGLQMNDR